MLNHHYDLEQIPGMFTAKGFIFHYPKREHNELGRRILILSNIQGSFGYANPIGSPGNDLLATTSFSSGNEPMDCQ